MKPTVRDSDQNLGELPDLLVDRYVVERKLAVGGMAQVFVARDIKHDRPVAIKLLKPELATTQGPGRFRREIRIAAQLNHPNILALIDSGEAGRFFYYVMPFVEGGSLREKLEREKPLDIDEALDIAEQMARALDFAHRRDVVHRDIKPENILFHEGQPMLADFGIALARQSSSGERLTEMGAVLGTPAYMSPEQLNGERALDVRTDVYSLGCVLFEMLTGEPPHDSPMASVLIAHRLTEPAPSARPLRAEISAELDTALRRALAREPARRTPAAIAFAESLAKQRTSAATSRLPEVAEVLRAAPAPEKSLAVLPFVNLSSDPDDEYFTDGITDELINSLARVPDLKVTARTSAFALKGTMRDVRAIGERLAVRSILEGGVRRVGAQLRVTAQLVHVDGGHPVWSAKYDREVEDVFAIQDDITAAIVDALKVELGVGEASARTTASVNLGAYEAYLRGRFLFSKGTYEGARESIEQYERAIELAPDFAAANAALAMSLYFLALVEAVRPNDVFPQLREVAERALVLDDSNAEAHAALALTKMSFDWDWSGAEIEFKRAIDLDQGSSMAHHMYGQFLANMGRSAEAITNLRRARDIDPLNAASIQTLGWAYALAGRIDDAIDVSLKALRLEPNHIFGLCTLAICHVAHGAHHKARAALEKGLEVSERAPIFLSCLATVEAQVGRRDRAQELVAELEMLATHGYVSGVYLAWPTIALDEVDAAFRWIDVALRQRSAQAITVPSFQWWDPIRGDPRFAELLSRLGFPGS